MNKKDTLIRKRSKRDKNKYLIIASSLGSVCMLLFAYHQFTMEAACTSGGSKLSFIFAFVCSHFGNTGVGVMWVLLGIMFFVFARQLLNESKKI